MRSAEVIIQARMSSTRLPGKVMADICGKPVLQHVLERVRQSALTDRIVVATSTLEADDVICEFLEKTGKNYFRGDEADVLARYYYAAKQFPADAIMRITADCPLIDPHVMDTVIRCFWESGCEYASNFCKIRTYPRGLDCEVFTSGLLCRAFEEAKAEEEREHVTPFMYREQSSICSVCIDKDRSDMRWTLDTPEDYRFIQAVYGGLYRGEHDFYMDEICTFLKQNPKLCEINRHVKQKPVGKERNGHSK